MTDHNIESRVHAIKLRRAEIAAALAAMKHDWVANGIQHPFSDRTALEMEDAALKVEALQISNLVFAAKRARRAALDASVLRELERLLEQRGMSALVEEAAERSRAALEAMEQ